MKNVLQQDKRNWLLDHVGYLYIENQIISIYLVMIITYIESVIFIILSYRKLTLVHYSHIFCCLDVSKARKVERNGWLTGNGLFRLVL